MEKTKNAVEVGNISKTFHGKKAVDNVSFNVKKGEIFGLLGPNGAGKTTLLSIMTTLLKPSEGTVRLFGNDVNKHSKKIRSLYGLTGQYASVDEDLSARENLMVFSRLNGLSRKQAKKRTDDLLQEFSLIKSADKPISDFSGGMRRRLDLAVSLISRPPIIFLDEPTTGLDPRTRQDLWTTIRNLASEGSTIILTTQYLEEADQLANRVAIMDHGKLVKIGDPKSLEEQIAQEKLMITFSSKGEAEVAQKLFNNSETTTDKNVLSLQLQSGKSITDVFCRLKENKLDVQDIQTSKPTLDDVFFNLTKGTN